MNRTWWKFGITLPWLGLPLIAFRYWQVWDRLPVNMATHFNAANQPNGWMSREGSMYFILGLYLLMVMLCSVIVTVIYKVHAPDAAAWATLGLFCVILGVLYYANESVLAYNVSGTPVQILPIIVPVFVAIAMVIVVMLRSKPGGTLPSGNVLAEEVHAGRLWALVLIFPVLAEIAGIYAIPSNAVRIVLSLGGVILLAASAMAWNGFRYRFTTKGVEISTLGYRLRSIPVEEIKEYATAKWNMIGGYGIRGLGDRRAYVWGNRGVRIKTTDGEVFLGHSNPDRIVHDLDAVKQFS